MNAPVPCRDVVSMSLVERKKLQWAREREELARLGGYWKANNQNNEKTYDRSRCAPNKTSSVTNEEPLETYQRHPRFIKEYQDRRGSLPPLYKNQFNSYNSFDKTGYDKGGETSGYGSDNNNNPLVENQGEPKPSQTTNSLPHETNHWVANQTQSIQNAQNGYESSSSLRDDRLKWGDKGVGVGKFWQPKEEHFEKSASNDPPNWVKRGLQNGLPEGTIVLANSSPSVSPEQRYEDPERPYTGSSYSHKPTRSYIRGQNIPIDEVELAERERKRQIALAHQEAIRQQLEERERKKKEEREQKLKEEIQEELRIRKEREYEKQRKLEEDKLKQEKLENERKRKEAIRIAMELAEKEAKLEKMKQKMMKQCCDNNIDKNNIDGNVIEKEKVNESLIETKNDLKIENNEEKKQILNNNTIMNNSKAVTPTPKNDAHAIQNELEPRSSKREVSPTKTSLDKNSPRGEVAQQNQSLSPSLTPRSDNFAVMIHPSLENFQSFGNFGQYAVLVPASSTSQLPIAIPIGFVAPPNTDRSLVSTARTENRILTPTLYRNNVLKCDSSTQTDSSLLTSARSSSETTASTDCKEKYVREKLTNLEVGYNNRQKDRRSISESTEERPKWGVNRPPTRYLKQSEKDPLYQRKKLRLKQRETTKSYDEKNSSDESHTEPPVSYRKKGFIEKRHSRPKWRTHNQDQMFTRNVKMYQREIVPLESNNDKIYYKNCCCTCKCQSHKCNEGVTRVDVLQIEENSPREVLQYQEVVHRHNMPNDDPSQNNVDIIDKLSSLHTGLLFEKERYDNSASTPPDLIPFNDH